MKNTPLKVKATLKRFPARKHEVLQAWDTADDLILQRLSELPLEGKRIVILNDQFGALTCALEDRDVTTYTDSHVSGKGIEINSGNQVKPIARLEDLSGKYDYAVLRIPKNMSFFEDMLAHLSDHLHAGSKIICGYMVKHQANTSFDLLKKYIGETSTSLAQKKARLIFAQFERTANPSPYPIHLSVPTFSPAFVNHSNLFSREKLDLGTRFLLENLPTGKFKTILDLGCANGIVGIAAKKLYPTARVIFCDDSNMAIQSAQTNFRNFFPSAAPDSAEFHWTNCFETGTPDSVDLVLCNPPFHQGNTQGDYIAKQMFADAFRALVHGGTLRVIGNTHLQYQVILKKLFENSKVVATNQKFMIVDAVK